MATRGSILVTGATGQQGGATARELLAEGWDVHAMTRNPDGDAAKALEAAGATIVRGDLDDEASLRSALKGHWGLYAVQNTWEAGVAQEEEQGKRIGRVARDAGIHHYVYASVASADRDTGIPHFDNKYRVEQTLKELDFPSLVILRPVFFMENLSGPWFKPYIDQGTLGLGMGGDTPLQMVAVQDIGKYGKLAFARADELNGAEIDFAGDSLTPKQIAEVLSDVAGRPVAHYQVPLEEVRKGSEEFAIMLEWFERVGYDADIEGNAERYGVRPTPFVEWARTVAW